MSDWRAQILKEFTPQVARLTLVADPDGLLLEEGVLQGIRERGFELIPFEDHVAFRYAYESKYRTRWDRGEHTDLIVVLRSRLNDLNTLPFDLLQAGRKLSFNLGDLFPNLCNPVVAALDRSDLDALYQAQQQQNPGVMGENATKDFVLRHVFEIAAELIKEPSDLLRVLLRRHYRGQRIPAVLDDRFIHVLRNSGRFPDWPLEQVVPDRQAFLSFLQERWPVFLDRLAAGPAENIRESEITYGVAFGGPLQLPFDHDDVRVYIDSLFLDGLLQAVTHEQADKFVGKWASVGILSDPRADRLRRLEGLAQSIRETLPLANTRHQEWLSFAYRWAELTALWLELQADVPAAVSSNLRDLRALVDSRFLEWIQSRYAGLVNQPPVPPVMLHHVPRALARRMEEQEAGKMAFVLVDGLSLDQWVVLRGVLHQMNPAFVFRESAVFAWLPTITQVSRQAGFAGKPPLFFPDSIHTTEREEILWLQFWSDHGLTPHEIGYLKDGSGEAVAELLAGPTMRVVGLIVDKVDRIMHGMELGAEGMHNQVRQWGLQGHLVHLLNLLLGSGFEVTVCSDHGNVEAEGIGRPAEGATADLRGERVRVYPDSGLRSAIKSRFPDSIEWPSIGLPEDYLPLIAPNRRAFIREGDRAVAHGGISVEELIVPLVQIERRAA